MYRISGLVFPIPLLPLHLTSMVKICKKNFRGDSMKIHEVPHLHVGSTPTPAR
jgi:hypothetical protein